jgi:F0F1-type ATP synthase assembly protein I
MQTAMQTDMRTSALRQISVPYRIVLAQLIAGLLISLATMVAGGLMAGLAAGLGALIVVLPNGWLAWRVTGSGAVDALSESSARILALSLMKFLTTAGAAALALTWFKPPMAAFLAGLVVTVLTAALVPPFLAPQQLARTPRLD